MDSEIKHLRSSKEIILIPENEIKDLHGNLVTQINMEVSHGTGMATGASCISFKFISKSGKISDIGGFTIVDNKLALIGRSPIQESDTTPGGKLAIMVNNYFSRNPEKLEKFKQELQEGE